MKYVEKERVIDNQRFRLETGSLATQADAAVVASLEGSSVLCTVSLGTSEKKMDFIPLLVEYQERAYAMGRIPQNFSRREGKPSEYELLCARMIDRTLRPLFPKDYKYDTQILITVLSVDENASVFIPALIGACVALNISPAPFYNIVSGIRIGILEDNSTIFNFSGSPEGLLTDIFLAKSKDGITLCELVSKGIREDELVDKILSVEDKLREIYEFEEEFISKVDIPEKLLMQDTTQENKLKKERVRNIIKNNFSHKLGEILFLPNKKEREKKLKELEQELIPFVQEEYKKEFSTLEENTPTYEDIKLILGEEEREIVRTAIIEEGKRTDGRSLKDIRETVCMVGVLPKLHGSALFRRGSTQALTTVTLGTPQDERIIEEITTERRQRKRFWVHYNFLPFSTGELRPLKAPSRREIGHGNLAERALLSVIPGEDFLYTIRLVSDILESNGSTSMATVCGGSLALMDAGVPIREHVAGISIGLVKYNDNYKLLTDITGLEDDFGDMDFKVAGTKDGITAIQLDTKISGVTLDILEEALNYAKFGRKNILDIMNSTISKPRDSISPNAPKVKILHINPEKIKDLIGRGGRTIKEIIEATGSVIDIKDDGKIVIFAPTEASLSETLGMIEYHTSEVKIGKVYKGKVLRTVRYGAFVEILPGVEGLVHISQLDKRRLSSVEEVVKEGDEILVKVINIDEHNRISLSRKAVLDKM